MKISLSTARQLALHTQGLDGTLDLTSGKKGAAQTIERLGYVQIDTINIIQRAHHHTFWSRNPDYAPAMLDELLAQDRRVFEGWTHAMSYIPIRDYRYYRPRMEAHKIHPRRLKLMEEQPGILDHVRDRIREEGPLGSADFKKPVGFNGGWWNWKPAKHALEALFNMGELMVTRRDNFKRIFDLTERVLPNDIDLAPPTPEEMQRYRIRFALSNVGVAREKDLRWKRYPIDMDIVQALIDAGEITSFEVEAMDEVCYASTKVLNTVTQQANGEARIHILSPFDNLTIRRRWVEQFFDDFEYRIECYVPAAKRKYGYFVLPILWKRTDGDIRFIARMDSKADRKPKTFIIKRLVFEPGFENFDAVLPVLADKLRAFARFNGCDTFAVENVEPKKFAAPLVGVLS